MGVKEKQISAYAKILSVADIYDLGEDISCANVIIL